MTDLSLIERALSPFPDVLERAQALLTRAHAFAVFEQISNTYAPTLTARHTMGASLRQLYASFAAHAAHTPLAFHQNYLHTGNTAIALGAARQKPLWLLAHADIISFLSGERTTRGYRLTPYCVPRARDGAYAALALGNVAVDGRLPEIARGEIVVADNGRTFFFASATPDLLHATRIVYAARAAWDRHTNMVTGYVDDAVGCAALTLAAEVLAGYAINALFVYCDEEEGVVEPGPRAFARGSDRLMTRVPREELPRCVVVSDGYDLAANVDASDQFANFGKGATFAASASGARGIVTPPRLLEFERALSGYLEARGVRFYEYCGYVSRSDDVSATRVTPNIVLIAQPTAYTHFAEMPRMHLDDLINLAKTLVTFTLIAQSEEWQETVLS